ncbi:MAG: ATP-binding protein [Xanthomonadales bacterium]|jgi:signal transduction histidine kinase|nr:ATP-binding protein [Xanthomonadales bacterium]
MLVLLLVSSLALNALLLVWLARSRRRRVPPTVPADSEPAAGQLRAEAVAAERERIYRDLHDDLGAKLLQLIYAAPTPEVADQARALLADLRDVVTRSRGTPGSLLEVLGGIRAEAEQRLRTTGHRLDWQQADALPDPELDHGHALHLHRIVREALSNIVHHAQARGVRVRVAASAAQLRLEISDDGIGLGITGSGGSGTAGMAARARALDGEISWRPASIGGTKVLLNVPLPTEAASEPH